MNFLTGENLLSENLLFQTLNTTARRLMLPSGQHSVLLDTVGFISDLPHELVDSFKSTLEGVHNADIILHIRDISHPYSEVQKKTVFKVLADIDFPPTEWMNKYIEVWNKVDLIEDPVDFNEIESSTYPIVPISALHGINIKKLMGEVDNLAMKVMGKKKVTLKFHLSEFRERVGWVSEVLNIRRPPYDLEGENVIMEVYMDDITIERYKSVFDGKRKKLR